MTNRLRPAAYLVSETDPRRLTPSRAEVAFVGRSNVGKSSTLNALCQQEGLARVSKTPGRTRMINVFAVEKERWLIDLPGYGFASGSQLSREGWSAMIEGYLASRPALAAVYLIVDSKVGPTKLDHQMREWLVAKNLPFVVVGNKIDQVKSSVRVNQQRAIAQNLDIDVSQIFWISASEGDGVQALRSDVVRRLGLIP